MQEWDDPFDDLPLNEARVIPGNAHAEDAPGNSQETSEDEADAQPDEMEHGMRKHPFSELKHDAKDIVVLESPPGCPPLSPFWLNTIVAESAVPQMQCFYKLAALMLLVSYSRAMGLGQPPSNSNRRRNEDEMPSPLKNDSFSDFNASGAVRTIKREIGSSRIFAIYPQVAVIYEMLLSERGTPCGYRLVFLSFCEDSFGKMINDMIVRIREQRAGHPVPTKIPMNPLIQDFVSIDVYLRTCHGYLRDRYPRLSALPEIETKDDPASPSQMFSMRSMFNFNGLVCAIQGDWKNYVADKDARGRVFYRKAPIPFLVHAYPSQELPPAYAMARQLPLSVFGHRFIEKIAAYLAAETGRKVENNAEIVKAIQDENAGTTMTDMDIDNYMNTQTEGQAEVRLLSEEIKENRRDDIEGLAKMRPEHMITLPTDTPSTFDIAMKAFYEESEKVLMNVLNNVETFQTKLPKAQRDAFHHLRRKGVFEHNYGKKISSDIGPAANNLQWLREQMRIHYEVVVGATENNALIGLSAFDSLHVLPIVQGMVRVNLLLTNGPATGKSFVIDLVSKLVKFGVTSTTNVTSRGFYGGNSVDMCFSFLGMHETPVTLFRPENPDGKDAPTIVMWKTALSEGELTSMQTTVDKDTGERKTIISRTVFIVTVMAGLNVPIPDTPGLSAMSDRCMRATMIGPKNEVSSVSKMKNRLRDDGHDIRKQHFRDYMENVAAHIVTTGFCINAGLIQPIMDDIFAHFIPTLRDRMKKDKQEMQRQRLEDGLRAIAQTLCVRTGIMMLLDPEFWYADEPGRRERPKRPDFEARPWLFYYYLQYLLYVRPEHVSFALSLCAEGILHHLQITLMQVIAKFLEENPTKKLELHTTVNDKEMIDMRYWKIGEYTSIEQLADDLSEFIQNDPDFVGASSQLRKEKVCEVLQAFRNVRKTYEGPKYVHVSTVEQATSGPPKTYKGAEKVLAIAEDTSKRPYTQGIIILRQVIDSNNDVMSMAKWVTDVCQEAFNLRGTQPTRLGTGFFHEEAGLPSAAKYIHTVPIRPTERVMAFQNDVPDEAPSFHLVTTDLDYALFYQNARQRGLKVDDNFFPPDAMRGMSFRFSNYVEDIKNAETLDKEERKEISGFLRSKIDDDAIKTLEMSEPERIYAFGARRGRQEGGEIAVHAGVRPVTGRLDEIVPPRKRFCWNKPCEASSSNGANQN